MKRVYSLLLVMALVISCSQGDGSEPAATLGQGTVPGEAADEPVTMTGDMELVLFDDKGPGRAPEKPTFRVTSSNVTHLGGEAWAFEDARATIYDRDNEETVLYAGRGRIDQETRRAVLENGVMLRKGATTIKLVDMEWSNEERVARSQHPATIVDRGTELEAASVEFYPDERKLMLTDVRGQLRIRREEEL